MEMTLEALVAAGISQEQAKEILDAHKAEISGKYVPKARFDEVSNSLKDRDTQIAGLKKFEGTAQELQAKVTELETANKAKDAEMAKALAAERKKSAMTGKLSGKVHDVDMVLSQIDQDKVSIGDDGALVGFDDQVKALQEKKGFLFIAETDPTAGQQTQPGFQVKGKTPPESAGTGTGTPQLSEAEQLGKQMAERKLAQQKQMNEGTQHYFK